MLKAIPATPNIETNAIKRIISIICFSFPLIRLFLVLNENIVISDIIINDIIAIAITVI